jgi:hypothetical protein
MLSLTEGRPIAKSDGKSISRMLIGVVDPDEDSNEERIHEGGDYIGCGLCCDFCDNDECQEEPCCENCHIYYDLNESDEDAESLGEGYRKRVSALPNSKLVALPDLTGRFVEYIAGPSGVGKSTIAAGLAREWSKVNPGSPIYIFSRTNARDDPAFKGLKLKQITLDDTLVSEPIDISTEVKEGGSLMIFDDCCTISNDKIKKSIEKLMMDGMEVGRKLLCNCIITNHLINPNERGLGRTIMNEMNYLTIFPKRSGSVKQINYALKNYLGLDEHQIDEIMKLPSRWVRISKNYPKHVVYERGAYILE